jgi:YihY family inner membrane protein
MESERARPEQFDAVSAPGKTPPATTSWLVRLLVEPWQRVIQTRGVPTLRYLLKTEAHTFAFSVAANAILSFFPFVLLLLWLAHNVFHSRNMSNIVLQLLRDHLPIDRDTLPQSLDLLATSRKRAKLASVVILFITSTGVFLPLEVALNQIWGFTKNRSYLGNQAMALGLAFACGILAMASVGLAAGNQFMFKTMFFGHDEFFIFRIFASAALKVLALVTSIAIFFLIYWLLPNGKVSARNVLPAAVATGMLWELSKYAYILALPWLDFREVYGQFSASVTLMFWAFLSGLMLLGGAHLAYEFSPQAAAAHALAEKATAPR